VIGLEARLIGYLVAAGAAILVVTTVLGWRTDAKKLPQIEMQLAATLAAQETARRIRTEVTQGYANELERLRTAAARGPRVIRVCDSTSVPATGAAPGGTDDTGTSGGELPQTTGRDIGPPLYSEADRADALAAQLRSLQDWVKKTVQAQ
jgi:type II secretory pathway pseudopilin PulG